MLMLILNSASLENYLKEFSQDKIRGSTTWLFLFPKELRFWAQNALYHLPHEQYIYKITYITDALH